MPVAAHAAALPAASPDGPVAPLHVLVADDEDDIRDLVCLAVRRTAASLGNAARGLEAGADAYLAEPFAVAGLVHQIRSLTGPGDVVGGRTT